MRRPLLSAVVGAIAGMTCLAAHADESSGPCAAVVCLSNGKTAPHECKDAVKGYFDIRVYHKHTKVFDPGATAAKRTKEVMENCKDARQTDKDRINAMFGMLERSPFSFY